MQFVDKFPVFSSTCHHFPPRSNLNPRILFTIFQITLHPISWRTFMAEHCLWPFFSIPSEKLEKIRFFFSFCSSKFALRRQVLKMRWKSHLSSSGSSVNYDEKCVCALNSSQFYLLFLLAISFWCFSSSMISFLPSPFEVDLPYHRDWGTK